MRDNLARVAGAGLLESRKLETLNGWTTKYEDTLTSLLAVHEQYERAKATFKTKAESFMKVSEHLEVIGDSQVESLEGNPDTAFTWNGGIGVRWAAADGGMEASIGFLTQLYYLEQLNAGHNVNDAMKEIQEARAFHREAMDSMLATGTFDVAFTNEDLGGQYAGQKMADVCRSQFDESAAAMDDYIAAYQKMQSAKSEYLNVSTELLRFAGEIEIAADDCVEEILAGVRWSQVIAAMAILVPLAGCLITAFILGVRGAKAVATPIETAVDALRVTTGTAASAITEMTYSISTIARNTERAASVSRGASEVADRGRTSVTSLGNAAEQIHGVVALIESIAGKTNLLALNATIEAARAGESGKGFAVVANEVKALARQTSEATQEIRARLDEMRAATDTTVSDINQIFHVISEVDSVNQEIARAADEQRLATGDISRCVQETTNAADAVTRIVRGNTTTVA
ncbi:MAG: hypothetical protein JNM43_02190 [Planctomycetaceae bacterium]|nr:hypothetical protein [Planctomycetaceae bacterium]